MSRPRYLTIDAQSIVTAGLHIAPENTYIDLEKRSYSTLQRKIQTYTEHGIRWAYMSEGSGGKYILDDSSSVWFNVDYIDFNFRSDQCERIDNEEALFCIDLEYFEYYNPHTQTWNKIV